VHYTGAEIHVEALALIPAHNEADSLPAVLAALRAAQPDMAVVVVDDASGDGTRDVAAASGAVVIRLCERLGVGGAVKAGLRYAERRGFDVVVRIDGDGQHPAEEVGRLIEPVAAGRADAVVGSRFGDGRQPGEGRSFRRFAQRGLAAWLSAATGVRVTDPTSGFWAFGPKAMRLLASYHPEGYPEPELLMLLPHCGLRVAEVPIRMNKRLAGRTTLTAGRLGLACATIALALVVAPWRTAAGRVSDG